MFMLIGEQKEVEFSSPTEHRTTIDSFPKPYCDLENLNVWFLSGKTKKCIEDPHVFEHKDRLYTRM